MTIATIILIAVGIICIITSVIIPDSYEDEENNGGVETIVYNARNDSQDINESGYSDNSENSYNPENFDNSVKDVNSASSVNLAKTVNPSDSNELKNINSNQEVRYEIPKFQKRKDSNKNSNVVEFPNQVPANEPVPQPVNQPVNQPVPQPVNQPVNIINDNTVNNISSEDETTVLKSDNINPTNTNNKKNKKKNKNKNKNTNNADNSSNAGDSDSSSSTSLLELLSKDNINIKGGDVETNVMEMYNNGFSILEISKHLGLGVGTVKGIVDKYNN